MKFAVWSLQVLLLLLPLARCTRKARTMGPNKSDKAPAAKRDTRGVHFWMRATFDPWEVAHEKITPPEYLGISKAEERWEPPAHWFATRNLTERLAQIFPLMDSNGDGFVDMQELERWHHINKVFVEKSRANQSMVRQAQCLLRHSALQLLLLLLVPTMCPHACVLALRTRHMSIASDKRVCGVLMYTSACKWTVCGARVSHVVGLYAGTS